VFKGTHLQEPGLVLLRGRSVSFHADRPFTAYADGDPIAELPATVRVLAGALRVIAP
jgi:diacylglycerol kinase family enzyme